MRHYRVRAQIDETWTDWSETCSVEVGCWTRPTGGPSAITLGDDPGQREPSPSPLLRTEFDVAAPVVSARLYVTSLGVYQMFVNGVAVSDALLSPGWSTYGKRIVANTYDVTQLLRGGTNALGGVLGDGWYRGRLGWNPGRDRCHYGTELGLLAQLEVTYADGATLTVVTDESWSAATGSIRSADIYDGCQIDLRDEPVGWNLPGFDDRSWSPARAVPIDLERRRTMDQRSDPPDPDTRGSTLHRHRMGPHGSTSARTSPAISRSRFAELRAVVTTHHAEVVEPDGSLHLRALRSAKASDRFVLADSDPVTLSPAFTFHGFRYADIDTDAEILNVSAVAISSDLAPRSSFSSSHAGLNQFESNVRWSQRDNFVGVPTDCPSATNAWDGRATPRPLPQPPTCCSTHISSG